MLYKKMITVALALAVLLLHTPITSGQDLKFSTEIERAKKELSSDLESPLAKLGLESIVWRIHRARFQLNMEGYEATKEYRDSFPKYFEAFRGRLWKGDLDAVFKDIRNVELAELEKASKQNMKKFRQFVSVAQTNIRDMQNITAQTAYRSQIYFAVILRSANRSLWQGAQKITYIYPLCFWQK